MLRAGWLSLLSSLWKLLESGTSLPGTSVILGRGFWLGRTQSEQSQWYPGDLQQSSPLLPAVQKIPIHSKMLTVIYPRPPLRNFVFKSISLPVRCRQFDTIIVKIKLVSIRKKKSAKCVMAFRICHKSTCFVEKKTASRPNARGYSAMPCA